MIFARIPIALLLCTLLFSCREKKDVPEASPAISADSVISPDKMILILADVHVIEAALLIERNERKAVREKPDFYYQGIFKKYHISSDRYDENLKFYRQNPENYEKMNEKVIGVIENRQKKFSARK